ncbi:MAG: glutamate--tRNA ligase [Patescibacteria group bacterium]
MSSIRTRFAPSPTGTPDSVHLGFVIRALWNYAYAKKNGGQFILRIEDTDIKRSRQDTEAAIFETLKKFGISWDEGPDIGGPFGPYRQSERLTLYKEAALKLVKKGYAYYDFDAVKREKEEIKAVYESEEQLAQLQIRPEAREQDPKVAQARVDAGEPFVVRVKIPEDRVFEFYDWILKKKISVLGKYVSDLIIFKSDGFPTYHLAVAVDDIAMQISHIFRGQEWISTTPIHLYMFEGLDHPIPQIGHFTVILDKATNKKFSKRDLEGKFGVNHWLDRGYLPEAILNYLLLLGWAPKDNREIFSLEEFVEAFDQDGVQKSNPIFDEKKLDWFNGHYIRSTDDSRLAQLVRPFLTREVSDELLLKIIPLVKDRLVTLADFSALTDFFFVAPGTVSDPAVNPEHLSYAVEQFDNLSSPDFVESVKAKGWKVGDFFMSIRLAIAGVRQTPPITETMLVLGKEESIQRLKNAIT